MDVFGILLFCKCLMVSCRNDDHYPPSYQQLGNSDVIGDLAEQCIHLAEAIRMTIVPIMPLIRTTVVLLRILIGTTVVWMSGIICTTGL